MDGKNRIFGRGLLMAGEKWVVVEGPIVDEMFVGFYQWSMEWMKCIYI